MTEQMANENIKASLKAETGPVTAEQRVASSEAIIANRFDVRMFNARKRAVAKPAKKAKKPTKKNSKK